MMRRSIPTTLVGLLVLAAPPVGDRASAASDPSDTVPVSDVPVSGTEGPTTSVAGAPLPPDAPALPSGLEGSGHAQPTMWVTGPDGEGAAFVAPGFTAGTDDPQAAAWEYFETFADLYGIAAPRERLTVVSISPRPVGTVVRFEQSLGGLPVYGGGFTVTVDATAEVAATVTAVTGTVLADVELADAVVDADAALVHAAALDPDLTPDPATLRAVAFSPRLDGAAGDSVPAWEIEIVGTDWTDAARVVLSALDGTLLASEPLVIAAEHWDIFTSSGADFVAADAEFALATRADESNGPPPVPADVLTADENMRTTWDYFADVHDRESYDGSGGPCSLYVHADPVSGLAYYSSHDGGCRMVFGTAGNDDDTSAVLDMVAHEFTHGVVRTTAELQYRLQSGALNEHYADFFAVMVDTGDWEIESGAGVLRDLEDPAHHRDLVVSADPPSKANDYGWVHTNNAIPNHAGFLAATTIGREQAEQVWYSTLLSLAPNTGFAVWACATITTALSLQRDGVLTGSDVTAVEEAMIAVGLVTGAAEVNAGDGPPRCYVAPPAAESGPDECHDEAGAGADCPPDIPSTMPPGTTPPVSVADEQPAACFVGVWALDSQDFVDQIIALADGELPAGGSIVHERGSYTVTAAADGTTIDRRDDWTLAFSSSAGTIYVVFDGVETGTWAIEHGADPTAGVLHVQTVDGSITVRMEASFGPLPGGAQSFPADALGTAATYVCTAETLEITTTQEGHTIVARFTRVGDDPGGG